MSANGMSRVFTPVMQGKDQQNSMNRILNDNSGDNTSVPVTGGTWAGGSYFSGNSFNVPPCPQVPSHSTSGIGRNSNF